MATRDWSQRVFTDTFGARIPTRFAAEIEAASPVTYRRTFLLPGESLAYWTEAVAVQVFKDHVAQTRQSAEAFLGGLVTVARKTCAGTVSARRLALGRPGAAAVVVRCTPTAADAAVETTVSIALAGDVDLFSVDWGDRTRDQSSLDDDIWDARARGLDVERTR